MTTEQPVKRAFYDFSVAPYSYDFVAFLICARSNGCNQVVFVPGVRYGIDPNGNRFEFQKCTLDEQARRLRHMLLPLCSDAIVCLTRDAAKELWHEGCFPPNYTVEQPTASHMLGNVLCQKTIYPFIAPAPVIEEVSAALGPNPIVIHMRDVVYSAGRNSNEEAWIETARWLQTRGENVWFIPDSSQPDKVYPAGHTYRKAAENILYRLALTDIAQLNLGVAAGNLVFSFFSRKPILTFKSLVPGCFQASEEFWERNLIPPGSQPPWFTNLQRIIWEGSDDAATIIKALETWFAVKEGTGHWPPMLAPRFPVAGVVSNAERSEHVRIAMEHHFPVLIKKREFNNRKLSLVCYGPSLEDHWQEIEHPIMTVSGAHDFLISKGVIPDFHVECDPRQYKIEFLKHPHRGVHYLIASCCHPDAWEYLNGFNVTLWHLHNGQGSEDGIRKYDPTGELVGGGSTVGLRAMEIAARLGYRRFAIFGMDCSYREGQRHAGYHPGKPQTHFKVQCGTDPREFETSPQMKESAEEFMRLFWWRRIVQNGKEMYAKPDIEIELIGDGLLQTMYRESSRIRAIPETEKLMEAKEV